MLQQLPQTTGLDLLNDIIMNKYWECVSYLLHAQSLTMILANQGAKFRAYQYYDTVMWH